MSESYQEWSDRTRHEDDARWRRSVAAAHASIAAAREPREPGAGDRAMDDACEAMGAAGRQLTEHLVSNTADRYARWPQFLDAISLGLSTSSPRRIIAVCEHIQEFGPRERMVGFGGTVRPVNLAGAILYARRKIAEEAEAMEAA